MYRNDPYGGGGDARGRRKRSFDEEDSYGGGSGGGYKRSRYDGGGGSGRPRGNGGDDRYGGRRYGGNDRYNDRGRYGGSGGSFNTESDRARAWRLTKKAIVELGEAAPLGDALQGDALRDHVAGVAAKVVGEIEHDEQHAKLAPLAALVLRGVSRLAHKTTLYAALVALVADKQPEFARRVLDASVQSLQRDTDYFDTEKAEDAASIVKPEGQDDKEESTEAEDDALRKNRDSAGIALRIQLVVRFLAELAIARVVRAEDVLGLLDSLQGVCTPDDFSTESDEQPLRQREDAAAWKDFYASVVLDALVHCGPSLATNCEDLYESLLSRCKEYVSNREEESNPRGIEGNHATSWLVRRLRFDLLWDAENDEENAAFCAKFDPLSLHWKGLEQMRANASAVAPVDETTDDAMDGSASSSASIVPGVLSIREVVPASKLKLLEPQALSTSLSIDPTNFNHAAVPPYQAFFRILTEDSGAAGAAIANLPLASYLVVRSDFFNAIETAYPKPSIAAKMLLSMCRTYNARFAASSVTESIAAKSEYLLIETLLVTALSETSSAKLAYYCSVLYQLVKTDARAVSSAIAIIVELLFREIPSMNAGALDAFVQLFSHFLSNFEYKWPWAHWAHVLEAEEDDAQRLFVSAVIERCVRLSYLQNMQTVLPSEFHMLLPPAPQPRVRFQAAADEFEASSGGDGANSGASVALREFYQSVSEKLKAHPPALALQTWVVEEIPRLGLDQEDALEVVWTCILEAGAATFTHMRLQLEKYSQAKELYSGEAQELVVVKTVATVWLKSPQHIGLILNAMLRHGILQPVTIATWLFTPDAVQQYSWPYVWGIVNDTVVFVQNAIKSAAASKSSDANTASDDGSLERHQLELQQMLKVLMQGFNRVISEHKSNCDAEGVGYKDNWFASALAQMKAMGRKFRLPLENVAAELQADVFSSPAADHDARKVFQLVLDSYRSE